MISVIMSAYKAEDTIETAINSVLSQTYKNWELIIVVDSSPDNTLNLAKQYLSIDKRIKVINNSENLGAGMSRRIGLQNIDDSTEYTSFLDSDDYYENNYLQTLYDEALRTGADLVQSGIIFRNNGCDTIKKPVLEVVTGDKKKNKNSDISHFLVSYLIKRDLWDKVEYSSRRYIEDSPTLLQLIYYANIISYINYAGYYYIQNKDSLIHTSSDIKNCIYLLLHCISTYLFGIKVNSDDIANTAITCFEDNLYKLKCYQDSPNYIEEVSLYKDEILEIFNFALKYET